MNIEATILVALLVGVISALLVLGESRTINQRLRCEIAELTAKVNHLESMNKALQEALAVVQGELAQARLELEQERGRRNEMARQLDSLQQQLIAYQMYADFNRREHAAHPPSP